ncbi:MAG TPA: hypothetical protein VGD89_14115 [Flavipsychrobacter sp.]
MLGVLVHRGYIHSFKVYVSGKVRAENLYYLSKQGITLMQEHKNAFTDPIQEHTGNAVVRDYHHRHYYVTCIIAARQYLDRNNIKIEYQYSYYTKSGSNKAKNLTAKTTIPLAGKGYFVPDGVLKTASKLYLIELYNDYGNIRRVITSLHTHAQAISLSTPAVTFGIKDDPIILAVFTHYSTMKSVIKRLSENEDFAAFANLYYFTTLESVIADFGDAFRSIHGNPLTII